MLHFFCFYNQNTGPQSKLAFSDKFKHVNIISYDGQLWLASEFDATGFNFRKLNVLRGTSLIRGLKLIDSLTALVVVDVEEKTRITWKPFLVRSCNEIDRYISGVDIGFTFNPKHLYNKLQKYAGSNYEIIYLWER